MKKLGEYLRLDSGTLSPLLKRLEAAGLVTRTARARTTSDSVLVGPPRRAARSARAPRRFPLASRPRPASTCEALEALKRTLETVTAGVAPGDEELERQGDNP